MPDPPFQRKVMNAIYGEQGVKAGHTDGACREELQQALSHLAAKGADVVILGCTELPLIMPASRAGITLVDPTDVLARRCVELAGC